MRRWLTILLLALLPVQFCWAVVGPYCGHEPDAQAAHIGHHAHQHGATGGIETGADAGIAADASADKPVGQSDGDCGHCHGSCAALPPGSAADMLHRAAAAPVAHAQGVQRVRAQSPPERPQWLALA